MKPSNGLRSRLEAAGWKGLITDYGIRAANRLGYFQLLKCVTIAEPPAEYLDAGPKYVCRFLTPEELFHYSADPANKLSADFLRDALAKGDECYAILDGAKLASYGWYSTGATEIEDGGLAISFAKGWVYMYKGYTLPAYRGQRLHAIGMARSLEEYRKRGCRGIVSYVAANNHSSLKSCYRMGYRDFGTIAIRRFGGGPFRIWHSPGCAAYGVKVLAV